MTDRTGTPTGLWAVIRREPLVLFVLFGALLFGAWTLLAPREKTVVRVEASALQAREKFDEELLGRPLTEEERKVVGENYIDDEVLLREALGRGLQWSDSRVRQRLLRIMRGSLAERIPDPTVAQLQAHFQDNIERFSTAESATMEQVFFPWESEISGEEIAAALDALRSGGAPEQSGAASVRVPRHLRKVTRSNLIRTYALGADFADAVENLPAGEWRGPIESLRGVHLVRIVERHPPETARFEDVERYLREDWVFSRTREIQQKRIAEIRDRYRIEMVED